jgi:hypothetical protein
MKQKIFAMNVASIIIQLNQKLTGYNATCVQDGFMRLVQATETFAISVPKKYSIIEFSTMVGRFHQCIRQKRPSAGLDIFYYYWLIRFKNICLFIFFRIYHMPCYHGIITFGIKYFFR